MQINENDHQIFGNAVTKKFVQRKSIADFYSWQWIVLNVPEKKFNRLRHFYILINLVGSFYQRDTHTHIHTHTRARSRARGEISMPYCWIIFLFHTTRLRSNDSYAIFAVFYFWIFELDKRKNSNRKVGSFHVM